ncbi:NK-tumor recognition protein isoform X1 [Scleropages formosus]|uniref:NK-tumor recognition protein isoform X1 n=1 Tax=Scleropages formosus TaxID=113540 RepID=UPI0008784622|nr:NK-tumor recognition protein isoform X1 [Scleropages formosus]XP_018607017.1 NK-tumor recognition protein isoform X1 [Scleropages formosus]
MGVKDRPQCYFDVEVNREPVGRIVFQLFSDICPKTSKNFLCLCTGEKGTGKTTGKYLCYKGSTFHRVVKNFMIQGGDFTEGNGKGGESIYGGYFEDENFTLKHDRAFLLSMANRGKDTNGSQFFITTKTAPHLDGVHVVFGLVISGFEVIKQIECLKTDSASRPYADVRVIDCGQLITKSANDVLGSKRKWASVSADSSISSLDSSSSSSSSSQESDSESEERYRPHRRRRLTKKKHSKKRRKDVKKESLHRRPALSQRSVPDEESADEDKDQYVKREKPLVRPEEIPPVPENRFLLRRDPPVPGEKPETTPQDTPSVSSDLKPAVTKSGRKIKGRGIMRYHTPPRSKSHSMSEEDRGSSDTPPHWKEEMQRTKMYQPPNIEKWSKGDKLNDRYSSRWDKRTVSPWSRSWSQEYTSDHSSEQSSRHSRHRKERKKSRHKKKSKKQKHSKRHKVHKKKNRESPLSEGERSYSSKLSSHYSSSTFRHSTNKEWSGSDRCHNSVPSSRNLRYSTKSKSQSYSPSTSRSRGRSRSSLRTASPSQSQARSRSQSRPCRRSLRSPRKKQLKETSNQKVDTSLEVVVKEEGKLTLVTPAESVLPLSESPPPSRWKPGQKPWKPSYVRIQEIKAKTTPSSQTSQTVSSITENKPKSLHPTHLNNSDSDTSINSHHYSIRRHKKARHSQRSSSRSRSYSRSCSHSRSLSPSKSQSSSYSRSDSYDSYRGHKIKRQTVSAVKKGKVHQRTKTDTQGLDKYSSKSSPHQFRKQNRLSHSASEHATDILENPVNKHGQNYVDSKQLKAKLDSLSETLHPKSNRSKKLLILRDSSKFIKNTDVEYQLTVNPGAQVDRKTSGEIGTTLNMWDSEDDSEDVAEKNKTPNSGKEEGEASSESEGHVSLYSKMSKTPGDDTPQETDRDPKKGSAFTESYRIGSEGEKQKHKMKKGKHKHKHKKRNLEKLKSKSKPKMKKAKKKHQRPKERFHWEPPLEFGEEDEEFLIQEKHAELKKGLSHADTGTALESQISEEEIKIVKIPKSHKSPEDSCIPQATASPKTERSEETVRKMNDNTTELPKNPNTLQLHNCMEICSPEHDLHETNAEKACLGDVSETSQNVSLIVDPMEKDVKNGSSFPSSVTVKHSLAALSVLVPSCGPSEELLPSKTSGMPVEPRWRPLKGISTLQATNLNTMEGKGTDALEHGESKTQGLRIEIKSTSRVRPGSLFDEVRKTARLNQRPRNQESSSDERTPSVGDKGRSHNPSSSRSKSCSASSRRFRSRSRSPSYSHSRNWSRSSSYSYRSYSRSRSRRRYSRRRSRTRSSTYNTYQSHSRTYSRSYSRSCSYDRHRRSRSESYDSYSSRSWRRSRSSRRSGSYGSSNYRSRSYRSYTRSNRSYSRHRSHSRSRYS